MSAKEVSRTLVRVWLVCVLQEEREKKGGRELQSPLGVFVLFYRFKRSKMVTQDSMPNVRGKCSKLNMPWMLNRWDVFLVNLLNSFMMDFMTWLLIFKWWVHI